MRQIDENQAQTDQIGADPHHTDQSRQITAEEIFATMADRFRPDGAKDLTAVFGFEIKGVGSRLLSVKNREMVLEGVDTLPECTVAIRTDERIFVSLQTGQMEAVEAMASRRLIVEGDMAVFGRLPALFMKVLPPWAEPDQGPGQELLVLKKTISVGQTFSTGPIMGKFLMALQDRQILAIQCPACGRLQSPPREVCAPCRVRNQNWHKIGPKGEIRMLEYCYYSSPDPLTGEARATPYGAIGILLDGCRDEEVFWHLLRPNQLNQAKMGIVMNGRKTSGSRVRPVWAENRAGSIEDIRYFELDL